MTMKVRLVLVLSVVVGGAAAPALASGFAFYEQGAKASGQASAWVARADDASANWYNPAALMQLKGPELQIGTTWLDVGNDTHFTPSPSIGGGATIDAVANSEFPSTFYYGQKVSDRWAWGIGINNPFGLTTEWKDLPLTLSAKRSELKTYMINPNVAIRISKSWSFAVGIDYLSAEVKEFSHDTAIVFPGPVIIPTTANLTGEGDGFGYNAALHFKMDCFSFGAQYRSGMSPTIRGNLRFSGLPGNFLNSSAQAQVDLPSQAMLGAAWTSKRVDVEGDAYYTAWNSFKSLDIETPNPATSVSLEENWKATWAYRLGVAVRVDSALHHEIRVGAVRDDTPIPTEFLRPSIPDADRWGYTLGYGWQGTHFGVDVYGMTIQFDDVTANGSLADGVIPGTYQTSILLVGGTFKYRF